MEMSSPLAAMRPPPVPMPGRWGGCGRDLPPVMRRPFGPKNFNFGDMSMKQSGADYFTMNPFRGSSPTASLAADISSNLHVDQSPRFQTPRRSLFTLDKRAEGTTTPPVRWEGVTTPPIPSSSPGFGPDFMDMSPLPHKAPFSVTTYLPSPTPDSTPTVDDDMVSPCELPIPPTFPAPPLLAPRPRSAVETVLSLDEPDVPANPLRRRKPSLIRPPLVRAKNNSTNAVYLKSEKRNPLPPFKFGSGVDSFSNSSSPSLDKYFTASPPQERRQLSLPLASTRYKPLSCNSNVPRANGSPLSANVRKPSGPPTRPRSKFRRSLSMYEHPGEVMNQKEDKDNYTPSNLQSVMDIDDTPSLKLPNFTPPNEPDSLPRISGNTLIQVLNGDFDHMYDMKIVIDCRFEYEFEGGHIEGAQNYCEKEQLAEVLFHANKTPNTLLIFHCEYSAHRAPLMAKFVRHEDRKLNAFRYPQLTYPEVYILDGGYSTFYESYRTRCHPQNYLRMDAKEHENACERGMNKLRQRSKLNRAQTFAFGQQLHQVEDSPTAGSGVRSNSFVMPVRDDTFSFGRTGGSRRMASY